MIFPFSKVVGKILRVHELTRANTRLDEQAKKFRLTSLRSSMFGADSPFKRRDPSLTTESRKSLRKSYSSRQLTIPKPFALSEPRTSSRLSVYDRTSTSSSSRMSISGRGESTYGSRSSFASSRASMANRSFFIRKVPSGSEFGLVSKSSARSGGLRFAEEDTYIPLSNYSPTRRKLKKRSLFAKPQMRMYEIGPKGEVIYFGNRRCDQVRILDNGSIYMKTRSGIWTKVDRNKSQIDESMQNPMDSWENHQRGSKNFSRDQGQTVQRLYEDKINSFSRSANWSSVITADGRLFAWGDFQSAEVPYNTPKYAEEFVTHIEREFLTIPKTNFLSPSAFMSTRESLPTFSHPIRKRISKIPAGEAEGHVEAMKDAAAMFSRALCLAGPRLIEAATPFYNRREHPMAVGCRNNGFVVLSDQGNLLDFSGVISMVRKPDTIKIFDVPNDNDPEIGLRLECGITGLEVKERDYPLQGHKYEEDNLPESIMPGHPWPMCHSIQNINISKRMKSISCGASHSLALDEDGIVYSWGGNSYGQLGRCFMRNDDIIGSSCNSGRCGIQPVEQLATCKQICCGQDHSVVRTEDGEVWTFGRNNFGQLGNGSLVNKSTPSLVNLPEHVYFIASNDHCIFAACSPVDNKEGTSSSYVWGRSDMLISDEDPKSFSTIPYEVNLPEVLSSFHEAEQEEIRDASKSKSKNISAFSPGSGGIVVRSVSHAKNSIGPQMDLIEEVRVLAADCGKKGLVVSVKAYVSVAVC
eukprot:TRINITY_DN31406_c0_g2_i1.p1 TRINITY_DN31406_c0_g2~~TRINITY_DN31406_c0_g2_i1.p1  ORF type:complete len:882 (-),score=168.36 TRINITY_DN31406_c0_g2_i1:259-2514(-)